LSSRKLITSSNKSLLSFKVSAHTSCNIVKIRNTRKWRKLRLQVRWTDYARIFSHFFSHQFQGRNLFFFHYQTQ
jgi:hypothetical protein